MNFPTNQVIQFYCVSEVPEVTAQEFKKSKRLPLNLKDGSVATSDKIDNVEYVTVISADTAKKTLKQFVIKVKSDDYVAAGEDYIVRYNVATTFGEAPLVKTVCVHATLDDTAATINAKLADAFIKLAAKDECPAYDVCSTTGTPLPDASSVGEAGFALVESAPAWELGTFQEALQNASVTVAPIIIGGDDVIDWLDGTSETKTLKSTDSTTKIGNGHDVADLEYFAYGEKGDSDPRGGFPAKKQPKLYVDPAKEYDILVCHYSRCGENHGVQKSERDLYVVIEHTSETTEALEDLGEAMLGGTTD